MKRRRLIVTCTIATALLGTGYAAFRSSLTDNPKMPIVTGSVVQNGWRFDGAYDGASSPGPSVPAHGLIALLLNFFHSPYAVRDW